MGAPLGGAPGPARACARGRAGLAGRSGPDRRARSCGLRGLGEPTPARWRNSRPLRRSASSVGPRPSSSRASSRRALRIAFDFRAEPRPGGSLLTTETRVHALTPRALPALPALLARRRAVLGADQAPLAEGDRRAAALTAAVLLIGVTAVWGVTFVQVKDAVAIYPLFAFLAVRYAIATRRAGPRRASAPARARSRRPRRRRRPRRAARPWGSALQTAGLERTTVTNTGLHHRPLRPADAAVRARALPDADHARALGRGRARARRPGPARRRSERLGGRRPARALEHRAHRRSRS